MCDSVRGVLPTREHSVLWWPKFLLGLHYIGMIDWLIDWLIDWPHCWTLSLDLLILCDSKPPPYIDLSDMATPCFKAVGCGQPTLRSSVISPCPKQGHFLWVWCRWPPRSWGQGRTSLWARPALLHTSIFKGLLWVLCWSWSWIRGKHANRDQLGRLFVIVQRECLPEPRWLWLEGRE